MVAGFNNHNYTSSKVKSLGGDFIESEFVTDIVLGVSVYIISLFVIINIAKAIGSAVTWTGLGLS